VKFTGELTMNTKLITAMAGMIIAAAIHAGTDARSIMQKVMNNDKTADSQFTATMKLLEKSGTSRQSTYSFWRKKSGSKTMSMIKFSAPARDKNIGLLIQGDARDTLQYLYLPKLNEVKRISGSGKGNAFMGSDFSYEDLEPKKLDDYSYTMEKDNAVFKGRPCYQIASTPKSGTKSAYSKTQMWVDKEKHVIHKTVFYKGGRPVKVLYNKNYAAIKGVMTARTIEMISLGSGHRTIMQMSNINHNSGVKDSYFTQRYLKRKG
jgi:outer membrane lipoprotein-sorting protein